MFWLIFITLIVIIILTNFFINYSIKDNRDLKKDSSLLKNKDSLNETLLVEKFNIIVNILNKEIFNNQSELTTTSKRSFYISSFEKNHHIVQFLYGTGTLTIIHKLKYNNQINIFEKEYPDTRNINVFQQQNIARNFIENLVLKLKKEGITY